MKKVAHRQRYTETGTLWPAPGVRFLPGPMAPPVPEGLVTLPSVAALAAILVVTITVTVTGCRFFELSSEPMVQTYPERHGQVLREGESISATFSLAVDETAAADLIRVSRADGAVPGSVDWNGRTATFVPELPLERRTPYRLEIDGELPDRSGRRHPISVHVRFFFESSAGLGLFLDRATPQPGNAIGTRDAVMLQFSQPLDRDSFTETFTVSPATPHELSWAPDASAVTITPEDRWQHFQRYRFSVSDRLRSEDGQLVAERLDLLYHVQEDAAAPRLLTVTPAVRSWPLRFPSAPDHHPPPAHEPLLVGFEDAIRIEFSKPMDHARTAAAVRLTPVTALERIWISEDTLVLIPLPEWESEIEYELTVTNGAADRFGNTLADSLTYRFTRAAGRLEVIEITGGSGGTAFRRTPPYHEHEALTIDVGHAPHEHRFRLRFSQPFRDDRVRRLTQELVRLYPLLPASLAPPVRTGTVWSTDSDLTVTYSGVSPGTETDPHYFLLTLPAGVSSSLGGTLQEDLRLLLRSIPR